MKTILLGTAALVASLTSLGESARAQIPQYQAGPRTGGGGPTLKRSNRPVVSRYTGLLGSSVGAAGGIGYQYFTRVQPQESAARALGNLGRSVNRLQTAAQAGAYNPSLATNPLQAPGPDTGIATIAPTGHPVGYMSHRIYFGTNLTGGTAASSMSGLNTATGGAASPTSAAYGTVSPLGRR